ncbi:MAG: phosphomannomutase/phosphoglucomutase, partial [Firmicutes bacterium]|nr:phosphomannomutase/phosphoglucomutase [Bacillota bacterium]
MALELKKLQNGSDIRGVSLDGVPGEPITLGKEEARALTRGFILWLQDKTGKLPTEMRISVGHDSRISADALTEALIYTMMEAGIRVFDCGLASTPAMFMSTMFEGYKCDGAIMITASH